LSWPDAQFIANPLDHQLHVVAWKCELRWDANCLRIAVLKQPCAGHGSSGCVYAYIITNAFESLLSGSAWKGLQADFPPA
jgi:hypothetical protein